MYGFARPVLLAFSIALLSACGGGGGSSGSSDAGSGSGGGGSGGGNDGSPSSSVQETLDKLNVDTRETPRVDGDGDPLPDDYAPFGTITSANRFAEIALIGVPIDDAGVSTSGGTAAITNLVPIANNRYRWELLDDKSAASMPWAAPGVTRASTNGDFDGDGVDEIAVVYQTDGDVELVIINDADENYTISSPVRIDRNSVNNLFIAAADFDGDVDVDIAVGLTTPTGGAEIKLIANQGSGFAFNGVQIDIAQRSFGIGELVLKAGNLDHDPSIELAVAVNAGSLQSTTSGLAATESWYSVFDDATTGFASLRSGARLEAENGTGTTRAAITNLDVGDIDGDNLDEIVLGGLNQAGNLREGYRNFRYFIEVIDDAKADFRVRARGTDAILTSDDGNYQPTSSGANQQLLHVPVVAADVDGDGSKEFLVGQHLFQSLTSAGNSLAYYDDGNRATDGPAKIPATEWFGEATSGMQFRFNWNTYSIAAGDVTLDGRENIVLYTQRRASIIGQTQALQVWGDDQANGWSKITQYANVRSIRPYNPQVVLPDIELDDGSAMLSYSQGSHKLVFTEPMVIAAIAASPCATDLGQDLTESCRSAYGTALNSGGQQTDGSSFTWRASAGFGLVKPGTNIGLEITASFEKRSRSWTTNAYEISKSLVYETGAIEDSVVFTSVPIDIYTYTVLSHVDPQLVGTTVDVRLPREQVTIMVTREKYNSAVESDSLKIDERIFDHTAGDISSYPSRAEKASLLSRFDGIDGTTASVGEGLGQTISTINSLETTTTGSSYEKEGSVNVRGTFGNDFAYLIGEVSVGIGLDTTAETSHGTESIYQGSVGNITSEDFDAGRSYNWGLFSYIYDAGTSQPFEVINFWVEQP